MAKNSYRLLGDTGSVENITGDRFKAAGYYGSSNGSHTVAIYGVNLTGRISIEATLSSNPTDTDWFAVELNNSPYVEYTNFDAIDYYTFFGNYVYVRAKLSRSYITNPDPLQYGKIKQILLNF